MEVRKKTIQNQEVSKNKIKNSEIVNNNKDSSKTNQKEIKKQGFYNKYTKKHPEKKSLGEKIIKTEKTQQTNNFGNNQQIDYETRYKNLEKEYNNLKNELNEKEMKYKSIIISLEAKIEANKNKIKNKKRNQ